MTYGGVRLRRGEPPEDLGQLRPGAPEQVVQPAGVELLALWYQRRIPFGVGRALNIEDNAIAIGGLPLPSKALQGLGQIAPR